ncbi:SRPBCC family protein [Mucilaginibacter ginkgonis]|uniref:SRPBCC domain-containing protein n=1 Tax=Mucilaginibacter ginkgonis TaxID=2682091 RepID=A0A6I4HVM1_9SPHI|nr:SRPBCC family protein [Mucilaginibacter ginkgonis]QQL49852.1 SRPBCC domain-containing protein [Mucilaginibacter ginkgonis]
MKNQFLATVTIEINAPASKVWQAITSPDIIKQYLFGTNVTSHWTEGSPITYEGEYNGKAYKDKGTILKLVPNKVFESTYWSSMSGLEDKPENYDKVTYELDEICGKTKVTLTQDNIANEEAKQHSTENWKTVLNQLKGVVEQ